MNKKYALEILNDVYSYSKKSMAEYGIPLIREAMTYLLRLKNLDESYYTKVYNVRHKLS